MHRHGQPLVDQKSLSRETEREGEGRMKKKVNQFFWLLGFRESQGSRQSYAQKVPFQIREPQGSSQELILLCKALLSQG